MSPLISDGMTLEEAEKIAKPAPKGDYPIEITGFFVGEDGDAVITNEQSGNKMLRVKMKIADGEHKGKLVKAYNAVFGTGFMAAFKRAFPDCLTETGAINTDLAVGLVGKAALKVTSYEGVDSNEVAKLYPKNA